MNPEDKEKRKPFKNLAQKTGEFFSNIKEGLKHSGEKIAITIKKIQLRALIKETNRWKKDPRTIAIKQVLEKKLRSIKNDTSQIKEDTEEIKTNTTQILLNTEQISVILNNLNYKSENIEQLLTPILPMLEDIHNKQDDLEEFLKDKLGSKWKKLKRDWQKYKNDEISRGDFILSGFKILGKTFLKTFSGLSPQ